MALKEIVNLITAFFRDVTQGAFLFLGELGPPILVALLTAVVTVQLTFWYHNRRDTRNALKAFQSELHLNDMETEMMTHDIFGYRDGFAYDSDTRTSVRLADTAYNTMKNSGTLSSMPTRARESIRSYYTNLRLINRTLEQRENIMYNFRSTNREEAIESVDERLLDFICSISGPSRLELVADRLNENESVSAELLEQGRMKEGRDIDNGPIYGDYLVVEIYVARKLESTKLFPELRRQLSSILADS